MKTVLIVGLIIASAGAVLAACEERVIQPVIVSLRPEGTSGACGTSTAPALRAIPPPTCVGRCCPVDPACYPAGNPSPHSGAECLAKRDNTNQTNWQLRQTLSVSTKPPGLVAAAVQTILARRSELMNACGAPNGASGFMQLVDFDTVANVSRGGFAKFEASESAALATGLCFVEEDHYMDPTRGLTALYAPPAGWPKGLPAPMPMPWKVVPVTSARLDADFTLPGDRATLLAKLDVGGELYGKANGVFYMDEQTGYMHGYAPLTYILNYDSATEYIAIPIRESEITQWLNDPAHPNCSGSFLGDNAALPADCTGDGTNRAWGCPAGNCAAGELAPTKIDGYFLIAELEQVTTLGQTLCDLFAGGSYPNWTIPDDDKSCRRDPKWNPLDSVNGLPAGDWCATTNQPASPTCHDAWKSESYATFQAFPIQAGVCGAL